MTMFEHNFTGRCPSLKQIKDRLKVAISGGYDWIQLTWGENQINLEFLYGPKTWMGHGWIRRIGGDDLAQAANRGEFNAKPVRWAVDPRDVHRHPTVVHKI